MGWNLCLCGDGGGCGSDGGGVDGSNEGVGVDGSGGNSVAGDGGESIMYGSGGVVRVLCIGALEVYCARVVDILVLGRVFVVEVAEGVEVVVGCFVRLVLWCMNRRGYFLCPFNLKSVEMNGLSVDGFLFWMVTWADCFVILEQDFLGNMVGMGMLMDVVVEVVVVEAVDVVQAGFFVFF